ncbi:putative alcohol dehydrogenase [Xylariaceae sp. FL0662B]|nr:putative alcohol dehydrogenase [Xylariaceae sp. FL0662B]
MRSFPIGSNGRRLPAIGLGTFQPDPAPPEVVEQVVKDALHAGYRLIDTAFMYGDGVVEKAVGNAIREWGGPREDLWITSKLANAHHDPQDVGAAVDLSLKNLGLEYIDLYLMHFPVAYRRTRGQPDQGDVARYANKPIVDLTLSLDYAATWVAMEDVVAQGKLRRLLESAKITPAVNQVELHPYLPQGDMIAFCKSHGIHVQAHSPLGGRPAPQAALNSHIPGPMYDEVIQEIAKAYDVSPAVLLLAWAIQKGTSVVPKSYSTKHLRDNISATSNLSLSQQTLRDIDAIRRDKGDVRFTDTRDYWGFDIFDEVKEQPESKG